MAPAPFPWFCVYSEIVNEPKLQGKGAEWCWLWIVLLALANAHEGRVQVANGVGYTVNQLAEISRLERENADKALEWFKKMGMVKQIKGGVLKIVHWNDRQCASRSSRKRTREYRERKKGEQGDVTGDVTCDAPDQNREDQSKTDENKTPPPAEEDDFLSRLPGLWNSSVSHRKVLSLVGKRRALARDLHRKIGGEAIRDLIKKVGTSDFLSGRVNGSDWFGRGCPIDWALDPEIALKILEGTYDNRSPGMSPKGAGSSDEWQWGYSEKDFSDHENDPDWQQWVEEMSEIHGWGGELSGGPRSWPRFADRVQPSSSTAPRLKANLTIGGQQDGHRLTEHSDECRETRRTLDATKCDSS